MADVVDQANDHADYLLQLALAKRPAASTISLQFCEDCGEEIPAARRARVQGCVTCVDCQELREMRRG